MLSCPNKNISENKGRKKLFLSYLVHFHCISSILESFLMSTGSSNHPTFYHESSGTIFKIKCWFREKSKSFSHKELLHLLINMSMKHCTPKISRILKNDNFRVSRPQNYASGHKTSRTTELGFCWICLSWLVHFVTELYQALLYREATQRRVFSDAGIAVETSVTVAPH